MAVVVIHRPIEVVSELAALHTDQERLHGAIAAGEEARNRCTAHHPPSAPGLSAYFEGTRAFRDLHVGSADSDPPPGGRWSADDSGNYAVTVAPTGEFAVVISSGDAATGNPDRTPKTAHEKGPRTKEAVDATQAMLFPEEQIYSQNGKIEGRPTWFLLRHRIAETVFAELSLPSIIEKKRIVAWHRRIILAPVLLAPTPIPSVEGEDIVVDVRRRRA